MKAVEEAKTHLILSGSNAQTLYALCNAVIRPGGRLAVRSGAEFHALRDDQKCPRCAATLAELEQRRAAR